MSAERTEHVLQEDRQVGHHPPDSGGLGLSRGVDFGSGSGAGAVLSFGFGLGLGCSAALLRWGGGPAVLHRPGGGSALLVRPGGDLVPPAARAALRGETGSHRRHRGLHPVPQERLPYRREDRPPGGRVRQQLHQGRFVRHDPADQAGPPGQQVQGDDRAGAGAEHGRRRAVRGEQLDEARDVLAVCAGQLLAGRPVEGAARVAARIERDHRPPVRQPRRESVVDPGVGAAARHHHQQRAPAAYLVVERRTGRLQSSGAHGGGGRGRRSGCVSRRHACAHGRPPSFRLPRRPWRSARRPAPRASAPAPCAAPRRSAPRTPRRRGRHGTPRPPPGR